MSNFVRDLLGSLSNKNADYSYYIFIDPDEGNKIKARNGKTGAIDFSHVTNADVVLQAAIDALSTGSTIGTASTSVPGPGDNYHLWTGGKYGTILVGPGTYYFYSAVILKSNIGIIGSGTLASIFTFPDNLYTTGHNNNTLDVFKSSTWDALSIGGGELTAEQLQRGETSVILRDFQIYGNYRNNIIPDADTATSKLVGGFEQGGADSWGHGIAYYGYNLVMDNVHVHGCPGAGIIIQQITPALGSGWVYPITIGGTQHYGSGMYDGMSYITNCRSWANGRQGLLVRGGVYVDNFWAFLNGEAAIDCQVCGYFSGGGWFHGLEVFSDGWKHGNYASTTYDPLGFDMRLMGSGSWISDSWIEGPWGPGDNLMLGDNLTCSPTSTGYQLYSGGGNDAMISNVILDTVKWSAIMVRGGRNNINQAYVMLSLNQLTGVTLNNATPMTLLGSNNNIDLHWSEFVDNAQGTTTGVVFGKASTGSVAWSNKVKLFSDNNQYQVDWQHPNNFYNFIDATILDNVALARTFLKAGGAAVDYPSNIFRVYAPGAANLIRGQNGGSVTLTGVTSQTVFNIPHLLFDTPNVVNVRPKNAAAVTAGTYYLAADATNVIVTFTVAPGNGTSNQFWWDARVSP